MEVVSTNIQFKFGHLVRVLIEVAGVVYERMVPSVGPSEACRRKVANVIKFGTGGWRAVIAESLLSRMCDGG